MKIKVIQPKLMNYKNKFKDILIDSLIENVKAFLFLLHTFKKNISLEFDVNDNFETFNLIDTLFYIHVYFKTKSNSDFVLNIDLKIDIGESDKEYLNIEGVEDLKVNERFEIKGNFDNDYSNIKVVKYLYFESFNADKYKINIPRTAMTGKY